MYKNNNTLTQLLQLNNGLGFRNFVTEQKANKRFRDNTAERQFAAMAYAQLSNQCGLRSIENSLDGFDWYHLGCGGELKRSSLAYANEHRDCQFFEKWYFKLLDKYKAMYGKGGKELTNIKAIDATVISLNKEQFPWAKFRSTKSGVKMHTCQDLDIKCPGHVFITNAAEHENSTLAEFPLGKSDIAVFDRGYFNKAQFKALTDKEISFVTRTKSNVVCHTLEKRDVAGQENDDYRIISDEIVFFPMKKGCGSLELRRIVSEDMKTGISIGLLTNRYDDSPLEIAAFYKKRWEVELFFKAIKQNLRIKRFYGRSENAVKTQIWIALIVYLLFLFLKAETACDKRSFTSFCSEISVALFSRIDLREWFTFAVKKKSQPKKNQGWLF